MSNTGNEVTRNESSLLLKYPINLFSTNICNENLLMPVGCKDNSDNHDMNVKSSEAAKSGESRASPAICQLEQPLLFGGVLKPSSANPCASSFNVSLSESTVSAVSKPLEDTFQDGSSIYLQKSMSNFSDDSNLPPHSNIASQVTNIEELRNINSYISPTPSTVQYQSNSEPCYTSFGNNFTDASRPQVVRQPSDFQIGGSTYQYQSSQDNSAQYYPEISLDIVQPYWFFSDIIESKEIWYGFSQNDSQKLEEAYQLGSNSIVPTDGGRCDVYLSQRKKKFVYFDSKDLEVRRCTWFHQQGSSMRFIPYDESTSICLEEFYHKWITSGAQDIRFVIPGIIGSFLFEKPLVMLHYGVDANTWTTLNEPKGSPKIIKRGLPDGGFQIMPEESPKIDHLLFIVQGIGSFCDLRFRTVAECVDGFRDIANKLIDSHFRKEFEQGSVGRVEILPVAWHTKLRTSDIGLDRTMKMVTLPSIPKLRHFTNDTLMDILLYSSPSYCQSIVDTVAQELNNLYEIFVSRNPVFSGKVFVAGHSLGSLILFDILSSQNPVDATDDIVVPEKEKSSKNKQQSLEKFTDMEQLLKALNLEEYLEKFNNEKIDLATLEFLTEEDFKSIGLPIGACRKLMNASYFKENFIQPVENESPSFEVKPPEVIDPEKKTHDCLNRMIFPIQKPNTGDLAIMYPRLCFHPEAFFAMGSPISMFLSIRGFDAISEKFSFPTCPAFFHIFHPYDPVAFRIEPMIDHSFMNKPVLIPHHKGRKRMHLEIKENVTKFANELRQKVMDTLHKTWHSFNELTGLQPFPPAVLEQEVNSIVSQEIPEVTTYEESVAYDTSIGNLNGGRRIDYVLQEKPLEALNDYVWALTSHATYWDSEDTVLMILREIYAIQGINVSPHSESFILDSAPENVQPIQNYSANSRDFSGNTFQSNLPPSSTISNLNIGVSSNNTPAFENANYPLSSQIVGSTFENASYSFPVSSSSNIAPTASTNYSVTSSGQALPMLPTQSVGPPPLTGFVKKSPFLK